jgi:hypothetical protein
VGVHWDGQTEIERLAKQLKELQDQVKELAAAGLNLPFSDTDPVSAYGNVWAFNDNRIRIRKPDGTIREVITTAPAGSTTGTVLPAPPAQPTTRQGTWSASWSQTYRSNGATRSEDFLHVGYGGDSYNGSQTSLVGWPYATIAAALAGASISAVEIYLYATHCWWNGGSTVAFASHSNTAAPGSLGGINSGNLSTAHVRGSDVGGEADAGRWKRVSNTFGAMLRDGSSRGVALRPLSSNASYYSILGGVGSGAPAPRIRITYIK